MSYLGSVPVLFLSCKMFVSCRIPLIYSEANWSQAGYDTRQAGRDVASLGQERQFNRGKKQEGERALGMGAAGYTPASC